MRRKIHLRNETHTIIVRRKQRQRTERAFTTKNGIPRRFDIEPQRRHGAEPADGNPTLHESIFKAKAALRARDG
jgi:hypothetical protein